MRKVICSLIISFVLSICSFPAFSQGTEAAKDFKFTIKTNPLSALGGPFWLVVVPLTGEYKVLFEAVVSKKSSFQVGAGYIGPSVILNLDDLSSTEGEISGIKTSGFRIQGTYKIFLSRDLPAPEGFYVGPNVSYATVDMKNKADISEKLKGTKLNINGVFGYQLITSGGFTLDIYTGMGFVSRQWAFSGTNWDQDQAALKDKASINIPFGFSFGYAF